MTSSTAASPLGDAVVAVLRWPAEEDRRVRLATQRIPRLLLLAVEQEPPAPLDDLEDWLRVPISAVDLSMRTEALVRRAELQAIPPLLDDDGLLRFRGRWVAIPDAQLRVVALLVARLGVLVRRDEIAAAYAAGGGTANDNTISTVLFRLRHRFAEVGLVLQFVRGRGVILEVS